MPNRIIRDGSLTSEKVNLLTEPEEVFYRRLFNLVDDFGRYSANPKLLLAGLYPLRCDTISTDEIERWLNGCRFVGLVDVYQVEKRPFLQILKFNQPIRIKRKKWPAKGDKHLPGESAEETADNDHVSDACVADATQMSDTCPYHPILIPSHPNPIPSKESSSFTSVERSTVPEPAPFDFQKAKREILAVAGDSEKEEEAKVPSDKKDPFVTKWMIAELALKPGYRRLDVVRITEEARAECKAHRMKLSFLVQRLDWERDKQFAAAGARSAAEGQKLKEEQRAPLEEEN